MIYSQTTIFSWTLFELKGLIFGTSCFKKNLWEQLEKVFDEHLT